MTTSNSIEMNPATIQCDKKKISAGSGGAHFRPHFRIDWRQLTYYHNESRSLGQLFNRNNAAGKGRKVVDDDYATNSDYSTPPNHRRKRILNSLDGCFKSGELSAILGPSGAGKSTFLSALFGNKQESSYGQTRVTWFHPDGRQMAAHEMGRQQTIQIAFLPQHDHLLSHLTVYETLEFASRIKNPAHADDKPFHRANVRRVAKMLKLTDCFHTRCGRLSGGQYKRVSIGQELLSQPDVIILDEPTSGLDAMTCLTTIRTLKSICAKQPISIILTIHQPDIDVFNLFDQVYVIAQGGLAIYEGAPRNVVSTLARVGLYMPSDSYNPARFIVENSFVADLDSTSMATPSMARTTTAAAGAAAADSSSLTHTSDEDEEDEQEHEPLKKSSLLSRSISSLTEVVKGISGAPGGGESEPRRPLLNLAIQTVDGKLITSEMLSENMRHASIPMNKAQMERANLLKRLNELQREKYYGCSWRRRRPDTNTNTNAGQEEEEEEGDFKSSSYLSSEIMSRDDERAPTQSPTLSPTPSNTNQQHQIIVSSPSNSTLASTYSEARSTIEITTTTTSSSACSSSSMADVTSHQQPTSNDDNDYHRKHEAAVDKPVVQKLRRKFDKRLSAKHNQSRARNQPTWRHARLLAHRTWLSIVRDPIFFGIQFAMHTTIPILLALIFGSQQDEGCPQLGGFDLVEFAYQPSHRDFMHASMRSIRQSIGNIGIMFFEMFVLCFAINCITALVFPLDMYVLLKEYRNGWYSLRSYFFGRTLADLPVPIVLHSMAMCILYYLTGQPLVWWRLASIVAIVILASLVAQSVGLTIGALLMRSSQSAVLAAAGIVAPFFALSGFIVRIQTLPWLAQFAARNLSYLYHLINGFIILRYGFNRCHCQADDFEQARSGQQQHAIPENIKTMASMWIGTYSNEYEHETRLLAAANNTRTNIDPNIDIIDKLMDAFKMAQSFGHQINSCDDVMPYAMLDFQLKDSDIWSCCLALGAMLLVSRIITFSAIYYKIRSFS